VRLVLAVMFSLALHVFLAELGGMVGEPSALPAWQPPAPAVSPLIEVDVLGGSHVLSRFSTKPSAHEARQHHASASARRVRVSPPVEAKESDHPPVALAGSLPVFAASVAEFTGAHVEDGISSESTTASAATQGSDGSGPSPDDVFSLGAFVERLKKSAQRCSPKTGSRVEASLARVRFCVDPLGRPAAVTLLQSTGDPILDRAALECVIPGAAPLPVTDRCLVVPLRFSL
jgi:TonB family protein